MTDPKSGERPDRERAKWIRERTLPGQQAAHIAIEMLAHSYELKDEGDEDERWAALMEALVWAMLSRS